MCLFNTTLSGEAIPLTIFWVPAFVGKDEQQCTIGTIKQRLFMI